MKHISNNLYETDKVNNSSSFDSEILRIRSLLQRGLAIKQQFIEDDNSPIESLDNLSKETDEEIGFSQYEPLVIISRIFSLSLFEQYVLLLCAAASIDISITTLCAKLLGSKLSCFPTISLVNYILPQPDWNAFSAESPLRKWQLIDIDLSQSLPLINSPLKIDESILFYLLINRYTDHKLMSIIDSVPIDSHLIKPLNISQEKIVEQLASIFSNSSEISSYPLIVLCGNEYLVKESITISACNLSGLNLHRISITRLSSSRSSGHSYVDLLQQRWELTAKLTHSLLLIDCDEIALNNPIQVQALSTLLKTLHTTVVITIRERFHFAHSSPIIFDIPKLTMEEQRMEWHINLGHLAIPLQDYIKTLVFQFNLTPSTIQTVCTQAMRQISNNHSESNVNIAPIRESLWNFCRIQARLSLDNLAKRSTTQLSWDDLILPPNTKRELQQICHHVKYRTMVFDNWQMLHKHDRGLGINALFYGASGLGKTTTAEIIAQELNLDLYQIDLSSVVNKYIGETEKNLSRIFDAAESGGVVLLFDEADALFGKRSQVKDARDRYANMEVSYLLQRMESYQGLSILTTNRLEDIDSAFKRRLRFIIEFPFPTPLERMEMWRRAFPPQVPTLVS